MKSKNLLDCLNTNDFNGFTERYFEISLRRPPDPEKILTAWISLKQQKDVIL